MPYYLHRLGPQRPIFGRQDHNSGGHINGVPLLPQPLSFLQNPGLGGLASHGGPVDLGVGNRGGHNVNLGSLNVIGNGKKMLRIGRMIFFKKNK